MLTDILIINTFIVDRSQPQWVFPVGAPILGFEAEVGGFPQDYLWDVLRFSFTGDTLFLHYGVPEALRGAGRVYIHCLTPEGPREICLYLKLR